MRGLARLCGAVLLAVVATAGATPVQDIYVHPNAMTWTAFSSTQRRVADDFFVPAGETWTITGVVIPGTAVAGVNYFLGVQTDAGGAPGSSVCFGEATARAAQDPEFRFTFPCAVGQGRHWLSIFTPSASTTLLISPTTSIVGGQMLISDTYASLCGAQYVPISSCLNVPAVDLRMTIRGCRDATCQQVAAAVAACSGDDVVLTINDG